MKQFTKVYPLDKKAASTPMKFINVSGKVFNTVAPSDYRFWELLNEVVQAEPSESLDPVRLCFYSSIGTQAGRLVATAAQSNDGGSTTRRSYIWRRTEFARSGPRTR